ncbi:MAG: hypothetical protein COB15_09470 [Flavobacteriales bacterium]|nr:MAG: hypothetical protein COB15_09470 [Flavobacteriales bacterium]
MSTEKNNILIAEFMGREVHTDGISLFDKEFKTIRYHDWNQLMPVVEHILDLELDEGRFFNRFCEEMASGSGIDGVYAAVVEAIEYINENE